MWLEIATSLYQNLVIKGTVKQGTTLSIVQCVNGLQVKCNKNSDL